MNERLHYILCGCNSIDCLGVTLCVGYVIGYVAILRWVY